MKSQSRRAQTPERHSAFSHSLSLWALPFMPSVKLQPASPAAGIPRVLNTAHCRRLQIVASCRDGMLGKHPTATVSQGLCHSCKALRSAA